MEIEVLYNERTDEVYIMKDGVEIERYDGDMVNVICAKYGVQWHFVEETDEDKLEV